MVEATDLVSLLAVPYVKIAPNASAKSYDHSETDVLQISIHLYNKARELV